MGKFLFRRIGGRIVPILQRGNTTHVLPERVGQVVENIRFMRETRKTFPTATGWKGRFIMEHETGYIKRFGQRTAKEIAAMIKRKK